MAYNKDVGITYDVCTHEQKEFRNNIGKKIHVVMSFMDILNVH